ETTEHARPEAISFTGKETEAARRREGNIAAVHGQENIFLLGSKRTTSGATTGNPSSVGTFTTPRPPPGSLAPSSPPPRSSNVTSFTRDNHQKLQPSRSLLSS
ncbi:unnamed protein product, partial [Ectocarpus sp. 13 AM-2016]